MTSHQTKTGNNFIMPIILTLVSAFVITDTLSTDNDKNLDDNLAIVQQETTELASDERAIDEKIVTNESVTEQTAESTQTTGTASTDTAALDLASDDTATIINQTEDATEVTEPGATSSTPALAENVALEIFEINTTATTAAITEAATKETQEDVQGNTQVNSDTTVQATVQTISQETAPQELVAQAISQGQDGQNTDTAIPVDEDPSESMPAATAPVTPTTAAATLVEAEAKTDAIVQPKIESPAQKVTQATTEQTKDSQTETPEFVTEVPLKSSANVSTESNDPAVNVSGNNDQLVDNSNDNSSNDPAINKPIFITPDENKLIFISQADSHANNPALNNKTTAQNRTAPNYAAYPPQNHVNQNYSAAQNQYQQYLYQQQQRQQYYAEMQQRQQAQQRAQQQAYQNEMKARQQRYLAEIKTKQEQHKKALAADKKNALQSQQIQLNAEQKIQKIQQKISQLNEEIRQLKSKPEATQKSVPATTQSTTPASKQM